MNEKGGEDRSHGSPSPTSSPTLHYLRLWRPAAQRNVRNRWSKLHSSRMDWLSDTTAGRGHATEVVNAYLSFRYLPEMNLGVLSDMPSIREKARKKLADKLELSCERLLSSYKDMVAVVYQMVNTCRSMRCYIKGLVTDQIVQFSDCSDDSSDPGDGGGFPVFTFFSILDFDNLSKEVVEMFKLELLMKRFLVLEILSVREKIADTRQTDVFNWSSELYTGEFDNLNACDLLCEESSLPVPQKIMNWNSDGSFDRKASALESCEFLEVYLTAWISDVNIDFRRIDEIFSMVEEDIKFKLS